MLHQFLGFLHPRYHSQESAMHNYFNYSHKHSSLLLTNPLQSDVVAFATVSSDPALSLRVKIYIWNSLSRIAISGFSALPTGENPIIRLEMEKELTKGQLISSRAFL